MGRCHEYAFDCELSMHGHQPDFQWQRFLSAGHNPAPCFAGADFREQLWPFMAGFSAEFQSANHSQSDGREFLGDGYECSCRPQPAECCYRRNIRPDALLSVEDAVTRAAM